MSEPHFPVGWDDQRVRDLLSELDARTEEDWVAADEAAAGESEEQAVVTVPATLLPEIRKLLAAHKTTLPVVAADTGLRPRSCCPRNTLARWVLSIGGGGETV